MSTDSASLGGAAALLDPLPPIKGGWEGAVRYSYGTSPTTYNFTGQRLDSSTGLLYYGARYYDPALMRFTQPDTLVPQPGNPQSLNRFSYCLNNPVKYVDPTGHWTEEELENALGKDWYDLYFGRGGAFEGRDKLLAFLRSDKTTEGLILNEVIRRFFEGARDLHTLGADFSNVDAIVTRASFSYGVGGSITLSGKAVLNLQAGELSFFVSPEGALFVGKGVTVLAEAAFMRNMPSDDEYRGVFESVGIHAAGLIGGSVGGTWSGPKDDWFNYAGEPNGHFLGAGVGDALGVYGAISYSIEAFREDVAGAHWAPYQPNLANAPGEILWALIHDVALNPLWPWSPYRR